eukprot:Skav226793  [mRNA]  locus=scaffold8:500469:500936:+ [translate_table: standard]
MADEHDTTKIEEEEDASEKLQSFKSRLNDSQKHELVGRALLEQSDARWQEIFESIARARFHERTIRFLEMSGRETELTLEPFVRLSTIQQMLADQMPEASPGMRRAVQCLHGSQLLSADTIAAMLPDEVNIVCREEPDMDTSDEDEEFSLGRLFG